MADSQIVTGQDGDPNWCRVTLHVSMPPAPDVSTVWVGLPLENWNGRFLGLGGGGYLSGIPGSLVSPVALGFAVASTDAGRPFDPAASNEQLGELSVDGSFVVDSHGNLNWRAVQNFAYLGVHDMTLVGKAVAIEFYGAVPRYSYFSGCSTGGRQGQAEVQRYPEDYDGVLSGAPGKRRTGQETFVINRSFDALEALLA